MKKDIQIWLNSLAGRGKVIAYMAAVGFIWLVVSLINAIGGLGLLDVIPTILRILLTIVSILLVALIVAQFIFMRTMRKNMRQQMEAMAMRGQRGGNPMEQLSGMRNAGSMRRGGKGKGNAMGNAAMAYQIPQEDLDKQYRPKLVAKPIIIDSWSEIEDEGIYALSSAPKKRVEIIDASKIGGGYYVAHYGDGIIKERTFINHKQTGTPLRFKTLRNAKQALDPSTNKTKAKPKSIRKGKRRK